MKTKWHKTISELFIRILPATLLFIATFAASVTGRYQAKPETYLLSIIIGFCTTIWYTQTHIKKDIASVQKSRASEFEYFTCDDDKINAVRSLYATESAAIYSTNIYAEYQPPYGRNDVAYKLYGANSANTKFIRIVSVNTDAHRKWVKDMLSISRNNNYELYVIEGVPERLFFPNLVIVKSENKLRLFISFRSDGASGNFAFATSNINFVNGLLDYFTFIARKAEPAEEAIQRWP